MSIKHCVLCDRSVEPKRQIGVGTFLLAVITGGFWLLLIPFYTKKCPICKSARWGRPKTHTTTQSITT